LETIDDLGLYTFPALFRNSLRKFSDCPALSLVNGIPVTYRQLGTKVESFAKLLHCFGFHVGSKVAIFSTGMPNWGASYLAVVNYGGTAVPLLPDFSAEEVGAILEHCGVDMLIVSERLFDRIKALDAKLPPVIIRIEDFKIITGTPVVNSSKETDLMGPDDFSTFKLPEIHVKESDSASIIYTSGTTGRSKGVELTHKNLVWTAVQGQNFHRINKMDRCLSFLPLSHVYEFTIDFTMQLMNGACVYYLGKPPVLSILQPAFLKIQPTIVCSVPIVMEKIFKTRVLPELTGKPLLKTLYSIRPFRILLHRAAGKRLMKTFGGHIKFFGIGGARMDPKVERFLKDARFPYAIGYGLTETSPLLAASGPHITVPGTIGLVVPGVKMRIMNPDKKTEVGEVIVKGPNVMKGYYRDPELTRAAFTTEKDACGAGWFKTGDLGVIKKYKGRMRLSLKGRSKNMILGPSGENIYPEDIEFVLNQHPLVSESLIVEDDNGLVALVQLDEDKLRSETEQQQHTAKDRIEAVKNGETTVGKAVGEVLREAAENARHSAGDAAEQLKRDIAYKREEILSEIQFFVNSRTNKNSRVGDVRQVDEFEKTASQKIKRYLYDLRTTINKKGGRK
jgi:long-chain acyl-CoA synthetase